MEGAEYVQCDATSPYGIDMSMQYPKLDKDTLLTRSEQAQKSGVSLITIPVLVSVWKYLIDYQSSRFDGT